MMNNNNTFSNMRLRCAYTGYDGKRINLLYLIRTTIIYKKYVLKSYIYVYNLNTSINVANN